LSILERSDYGYAWPDAFQIKNLKGHFVIQAVWVSW